MQFEAIIIKKAKNSAILKNRAEISKFENILYNFTILIIIMDFDNQLSRSII